MSTHAWLITSESVQVQEHGYADKPRKRLTVNAKDHAYTNGTLKKGTRVTCKEVKRIGDDVWIRTPSGWIAAYYGGKKYVG